MRSLFAILLLALLAPLLASCSPDPALLTKADERALAARFFATVERARTAPGDFPVLAESSLTAGAYRRIADELPASARPVMVGAQRFAGTNGNGLVLSYSLEGDGRYKLVSLAMVRSAGSLLLVDSSVTTLNQPLAEAKRFRLAGQPASALALLLLPLLSLGVAIAAILRVWRSRRFGRRWLWSIGCLLGLSQFIILWPTGRLVFQPLFIALLPAGVRQIGPLPDSWLISAAVPVVALVVLAIRRGPPKVAAGNEAPEVA